MKLMSPEKINSDDVREVLNLAKDLAAFMRALGRGTDGAPGLNRSRDAFDYGVMAMNFGISVVAGLFTGGVMRMFGR